MSSDSNPNPTQPEFWTKQWENNQTRWDKSKAHPLFKYLLEEKSLFYLRTDEKTEQDKERLLKMKEEVDQRLTHAKLAMVPGCGSGYDADQLAKIGLFEKVLGIDLSSIATERATKSYQQLVNDGKLEFKSDNFFKLHEQYGGQVDFIWDYTFLCALEPSMRNDWAEEMTQLISKGGFILTCVFPLKPFGMEGRPPYVLSVDLIQDLLKDSFELVHQEDIPDDLSHEEREEKYALWRRI